MFRASLLCLALAACGHGPGGKLMVDTPILPYTPPDFDEPDSDATDEAKPEPKAKPEAVVPVPVPVPTPTPAPPKTPPATPAKK